MTEITVGHRLFSEQNHVLTDYLEACSVKRPTSSKTVGKSSQIKNQASYNRCHIKLIAYLTAAQRPSDYGGPIGCYHMTTDDRRLVLIFGAHVGGFKLKLFCEDFGRLEAFRLCTFEDIPV